jgi:hypothetical protein
LAWYTAECLYRSELPSSGATEQLCEYRYFLLKADDDESASEKARSIAKKKQHRYLNEKGEEVNWILEEVVDTKQVLSEGFTEEIEIYHRYFSRPVPNAPLVE